jgi:hypothetical protein
MSDLTGASLQQRNLFMTGEPIPVHPVQSGTEQDPGRQPVQIRYQRIHHQDGSRPCWLEKIEGNLCIEHLFDNLPDR